MSQFLSASMIIGFVVAQGGVVFVSAWLLRRLLKLRFVWSKPLLMTLSCLAWIIFTLTAYFMLGGSGGVMEGMGMMLMLCLSCAVSSFVYSILWAIIPAIRKPANG